MIEQLVKPNPELTTAIYDADFIPFVCCYNNKEFRERTYEECVENADRFIKSINNQTGAEKFIMCFTLGKKTFRHKLYPEYKANRKEMIPINHSREIRKYLLDNYGGVFDENYEADDLVLSLNRKLPNSFIISPDKDVLTTMGYRFNPKKKEWLMITQNDELYSFWTSVIVG